MTGKEKLRSRSGSMPVRPALVLAAMLVRLLAIALPVGGRTDAVDADRTGDGRRLSPDRAPSACARPSPACSIAARRMPTIGGDRLVGLTEMLPGAILHRAHRLAGPLVVHVDVGAHAGEGVVRLLVRIEAVIVAACSCAARSSAVRRVRAAGGASRPCRPCCRSW